MTITAKYGEKVLKGLPDAIHNEATTVHRKKNKRNWKCSQVQEK